MSIDRCRLIITQTTRTATSRPARMESGIFVRQQMTLEKLYWRWHVLATSLWEYAELAEGRERLRRETPACIAEEIVNALARAYHQKVSVWTILEHRRDYAIQSHKAAPHLWERRQSAALFRLLRMQLHAS